MSKKIHTEAVDHLFEAVLCLENKEECYTFFEDVCTINELLSLSQRFEVARMLRQNIEGKRAGHGIDDPGFLQPDRPMSAIGG